MINLSDSPTGVKHAVKKTAGAKGRGVTWPNVLVAIQSDKTRSSVLAGFRAAKFSGDDWSQRAAREKMAHLLAAAEDRLELTAGPRAAAERLEIRGLRRRLELELWG